MNKSESKYYNTALLMDEALLILLETKDFEFITVKEICLKAGVNRSTFYLHYENTSDLLVETIEMITKRFYESFNNENHDVFTTSKEESIFINEKYLIPYLNFVKENKKIFKLIHDKPQLFSAQKIANQMYKDFFSPILDKFGVEEKEKIYIFSFFTQGTLAIVLRWLANNCKEEVEEMSALIIRILNIQIKK